jgi:hypothetical protein
MTRSRDPNHLIRAFLDDGPEELPDRSYDAVRSAIDRTRQRAVIGPWKEPRMSNLARIAMLAAAVVVIAVVGYNLIPGNKGVGGIGPVPTATATPVPTPTAPPVPLPTTSGSLAAGTYYVSDRSMVQASRLTLTVPAGWSIPTSTDAFVIKNEGKPGEVLVTTWIVSHIFADACHWSVNSLVNAGTSVDQLVSALVVQKGRKASTPSDVTVAGFSAKRLDLTVSPTLDVATCTNGNLRYWPGAGPDLNSGLCCNPAGNIDAIYVVNIAGNRLVVVARQYPGSTAADKAELQAIVDSIQIQP